MGSHTRKKADVSICWEVIRVLYAPAYQCLDNIKMYKYAKFDQDMPRGLREMSIFTNWPRPAELVLSTASSIEKCCYACQWLAYVCKIWLECTLCVQELWAFSLTANRWTGSRSVKPRSSKQPLCMPVVRKCWQTYVCKKIVGSKFWISYFWGFSENLIFFLGVKILWIFFWGHRKIGLYLVAF